MENIWCVASDLIPLPLSANSEKTIIALAEQHPEVIVFAAEFVIMENLLESYLRPVDI